MRSSGEAGVNAPDAEHEHAHAHAGERSRVRSGALASTSQFEVKGAWFTSARRYVIERHGAAALEAIALEMPEPLRDAMLSPLPSLWYPEEALQSGMHAMHRLLADGDADKFVSMMEACTQLGVTHFFRALIRLGTPAMVLRKVPTMWSHIRRGPAIITVDADDERAVVTYSAFPYFYDATYRLMTLGGLRAVTWICARRVPKVEIAGYERDALTVVVTYKV